jgi:hypothetical protein
MQLKSPCPQCGKRARYSPDEVGLPAVCAACGTRFTLPPPAPKVPLADIPMAEPVEPGHAHAKPWVWMALGGGLAVGVVVGIVVAVMMNRPGPQTTANGDNGAGTSSQSSSNGTPHDSNHTAVPSPKPSADIVPQPVPPRASANSVVPGPIAMNVTPGSSPLIPRTGSTPSATTRTAKHPKPAPVQPDNSPRPPPQPIPPDNQIVTDERIGKAITDGVSFLTARFDNTTHELKQNRIEFQGFGGAGKPDQGAFYGGLDALCVYALLQSGQAIPDKQLGIKSPYMLALLDQLKKLADQSGPVTYARALRATALGIYNRPEDKAAIRADFDWLLKNNQGGAYTYDKIDPAAARRYPPLRLSAWDNSNSQYGLLGVWSASEAGVEVPTPYWKQVEDHWTKTQMPDGQWGYEGPESGAGRLSMTCAGIASLFVTHDVLVAPKFGVDVGRDPFSPALLKGLNWLETADHSVNISAVPYMGYTLYGIERAGLASGFKYFGEHDWYRELAQQVIELQHPDGSWGSQPLIDTPYVLLFLARGRHPILMNKLRFDGFWANRPRDVVNLARYVSKESEQPLNWQVVPISHDWADWTDCPILYMASHKAPELTDHDYDNIRGFIQSGGLLFTQADGDAPEFNTFVKQMSAKLFPAYEIGDLPPDHPIYSVLFKEAVKPKLQGVSNGARLLMVHSPVDLSKAWQMRAQAVQKMPFEFGMNLFLYATGKHELRNRLVSNVIPAPKATPTCTLSVARLRYAGNWDPEPYAWTRFSRWFQTQTSYGLDVQTVDMSDLTPQTAPVAILTGTAAYNFKPEEVAAAKKYVEAGGMLFVDLAGGSGAFEESARVKLFGAAFPNDFLQPLAAEHPMVVTGGMGMLDVSHARLRPFAMEKLGNPKNELPSYITVGKGHVIFTPIDMTCGILGTYTWGIMGYDPDYCDNFVKNMLLWTADGQKDE